MGAVAFVVVCLHSYKTPPSHPPTKSFWKKSANRNAKGNNFLVRCEVWVMGLRMLKLHIAGAGGAARKKGARRFLVLWEQASTGSLSPCSLCRGKRADSRVNLPKRQLQLCVWGNEMLATLELLGSDPSPVSLSASFLRALRIILVTNIVVLSALLHFLS